MATSLPGGFASHKPPGLLTAGAALHNCRSPSLARRQWGCQCGVLLLERPPFQGFELDAAGWGAGSIAKCHACLWLGSWHTPEHV